MKKTILIVTAVYATLTLSACAVKKDLVPTGGSRADGTIRLSYQHGKFEAPQVDPAQGLALAKQRCAAWGYSGAEAFGGQTKTCALPAALDGCKEFLVTVEYQCIGIPEQRK